MIFIAFTVLTALFSFTFELSIKAAQEINLLHKWCVQSSNIGSDYDFVIAALSCGERIKPSSFAKAIKDLGIVHYFVISGLHVYLIDRFFISIKLKSIFFRLLVQLTFLVLCNFNPPILRAFFYFLFKYLNESLKLFWTTSLNCLMSCLFLLAVFPELISSLSFILSSTACICVQISKDKGFFNFHLYLFFLIMPVLIFVASPQPISILINPVLSPIFSTLLLPLTFLSHFFDFIKPIFNFTWDFLEKSFIYLSGFSLKNNNMQFINKHWAWVYIFCLHIYLHKKEVKKYAQ